MNKSTKTFCFCKNCCNWASCNGKWGICSFISNNDNGSTHVTISLDDRDLGWMKFETFENFGCIFGKEKISFWPQ